MAELLAILRHNVNVEADVNLAREELAALCCAPLGSVVSLSQRREIVDWLERVCPANSASGTRFACRMLREEGAVGLTLSGVTPDRLSVLLARSSFLQEVVFAGDPLASPEGTASPLVCRATAHEEAVLFGIPMSAILEYSAPLLRDRERIGDLRVVLDELIRHLLEGTPCKRRLVSSVKKALAAKKTTLYLSHELHLYKGKFFPRLVRSLVNRYSPTDGDAVILDPFVGSGTLLLEAALLGHESVGLDVDPTSVLISREKLSLVGADLAELAACVAMTGCTLAGFAGQMQLGVPFDLEGWPTKIVEVPEPMYSRLQKRGGETGEDLLGEIQNGAAMAMTIIDQLPAQFQDIFRVCLSHALTKKIRLRFVGIGNGRFTFDVAKTPLLSIFRSKAFHLLAVAEVFNWLEAGGLRFGSTTVHQASALDSTTVLGEESVDLIITSPPYIPASSGREHYARARSIPLVLTGAASVEELDRLDAEFMGEMRSGDDPYEPAEVVPSIRRTLDFLQGDKQRRPKFKPTLQYYRDMEATLLNCMAVLRPGGRALFVVASSHTFYVHKTKEVLHTVKALAAVSELGQRVGFDVEREILVPLQKSGNLNARPRSTDEYAEGIVVFRKAEHAAEPPGP